MRTKKTIRYGSILTLLLWLPLSGCATSDSYTNEDKQGPPSGMSGGGMGRGGGHKQGPPDMDVADIKGVEAPPVEAFTACEGKQEGDSVVYILPGGQEIKATCRLIEDHLVAMPTENRKRGPRN